MPLSLCTDMVAPFHVAPFHPHNKLIRSNFKYSNLSFFFYSVQYTAVLTDIKLIRSNSKYFNQSFFFILSSTVLYLRYNQLHVVKKSSWRKWWRVYPIFCKYHPLILKVLVFFMWKSPQTSTQHAPDFKWWHTISFQHHDLSVPPPPPSPPPFPPTVNQMKRLDWI